MSRDSDNILQVDGKEVWIQRKWGIMKLLGHHLPGGWCSLALLWHFVLEAVEASSCWDASATCACSLWVFWLGINRSHCFLGKQMRREGYWGQTGQLLGNGPSFCLKSSLRHAGQKTSIALACFVQVFVSDKPCLKSGRFPGQWHRNSVITSG